MEKPRLDIVKQIWLHSRGWWGMIATLDRTRVPPTFQETPVLIEGPRALEQGYGKDLYFSALRFNKEQRANENFAGARVLFADLDSVDPNTLDPRPTIAWETSHKSYQAVWFLDKTIGGYIQWADLNRRLTYHVGADRGGWAGSKLLRVPGTINFKRATEENVPLGRLLWQDGPMHNLQYLEKMSARGGTYPLTDTQPTHQVTGYPDPGLNLFLVTEARLWPQLGIRSRSMLHEDVRDRSLHIVRCIHQFAKDGIGAEDIWHLLWFTSWNKWRLQGNPERMWQEILRVVEP